MGLARVGMTGRPANSQPVVRPPADNESVQLLQAPRPAAERIIAGRIRSHLLDRDGLDEQRGADDDAQRQVVPATAAWPKAADVASPLQHGPELEPCDAIRAGHLYSTIARNKKAVRAGPSCFRLESINGSCPSPVTVRPRRE